MELKIVRSILLVVIVICVSACAGTKSLNVNYEGADSTTVEPDIAKIDIAQFLDDRSWAAGSDPNAASFVASQGAWRFGLTHEGKSFIPISLLIQDLLVAELNDSGIPTRSIPKIVSSADLENYKPNSVNAEAPYLLGGDILVFQFDNDASMWTVDSRRTVTLDLRMVSSKTGEVVIDRQFHAADNVDEGMGVLHSTNVDFLVNRVFREVADEIVEMVKGALSEEKYDTKHPAPKKRLTQMSVGKGQTNIVEQLKELNQLKELGVITEDEFIKAKQSLLNE